jgi:hypothetical protein
MAGRDESSFKPTADPENPPFSAKQIITPLEVVCQGRLVVSIHHLEFADWYNRVWRPRLR